MSIRVFALTAACVYLCAAGAFAQTNNTSPADDKFIRAALSAGTTEIKEGTLFADSGNNLVQTFATRMVKDHSEANTQLLALARQLNVTVPDGTLPESGQSEQSPLPENKAPQNNAAASTTPKQYFAQQVTAHQKAVALFKSEIADGTNSQVKAFAQKTLPVLETHLSVAQQDLKSAAH